MKKAISLLFLTTVFASGVRLESLFPSHYELGQLLVVNAIGVDASEDGSIIVTLAYSSAEENGSTALLSAAGSSLSSAMNTASSYAGRNIFLGHVRIIIVGNELAASGLTDMFDFFMRNYETRASIYVVTSAGKASDVLSVSPSSGTDVVDELETLLKSLSDNSLSYSVSMGDMIADFFNPLRYSATPLVESVKNSDGKPAVNVLLGSAVYRENKMLFAVTGSEAVLLTLLRNDSEVFTTVCVADDGTKYSVKISGASTKYNFEEGNGRLNVLTDVSLHVSVIECSSGIFGIGALEDISGFLDDYFEEQIRNFLETYRDRGVDIVHTEDTLKRFHPSLYKNYGDVSQMNFRVNVRCLVENSFISEK